MSQVPDSDALAAWRAVRRWAEGSASAVGSARSLVLWDGECGLCARAVRWARVHDEQEQLAFISYQEVPAPPMTPELAAACARAVHLVTPDGQVLRAGRASLAVLSHTGWPRLARAGSAPPLRWGVEAGYALVARNRRLFSRFLFREEGSESLPSASRSGARGGARWSHPRRTRRSPPSG